MKLYLTGMLVCASVLLHSQSCDSTTTAAPGTFELRRIPGTSEANESVTRPLTEEELCVIEAQRHPSQAVTIRLDDFTEVKIYPGEGKRKSK